MIVDVIIDVVMDEGAIPSISTYGDDLDSTYNMM
jgi:hypothetical protein|tara:strand:+ start:427 stop:528 length:102 start_codon:yes stop_codon:yes gene_type:complete